MIRLEFCIFVATRLCCLGLVFVVVVDVVVYLLCLGPHAGGAEEVGPDDCPPPRDGKASDELTSHLNNIYKNKNILVLV